MKDDKKESDDKNDQEDNKELNRIINEIKDNSNGLTKEEIDEITNALMKLKMQKRSKKEIFKLAILSFLSSFFMLYIISLLGFGFCFNEIALKNRWLVFLVSAIVSVSLSMFESLPSIKIFKNQFLNYIFMFFIIVVVFYLLNFYVYQTFTYSFMWIIYLVLVELASIIIRIYLMKKKLDI